MTPRERYSQVVDAALTDVTQRIEQRQSQIKDPKVNGFLSPRFEYFWGGGAEAESHSVRDAINAWVVPYSYQISGVTVDHAGLLAKKDAAYLKARSDFEALLPDLIEALGKPLLQPANDDPFNPTRVFNEQALTSLTIALNAYAESLLLEGNAEKSALAYELAFRLGALVFDDVASIQTMIGVSLQGLAFQSLVGYFQPAVPLSPVQWAGFSQAVSSVTPTPITLGETVQKDLAFGVHFLQQPRSSYDGDARFLRGTYLIPGMRARDQRTYRNVMGEVLEESKTGVVKQDLPSTDALVMLRGESGPGTVLLTPNYEQQSARFTLHAAKMSGFAACAGVAAYRALHERLPASLAELDTLNLQAPGGNPWSTVKGISYSLQGEQAQILVVVNPELYSLAGIDFDKAQFVESSNSVYFSLVESGFLFRL